MFKKFLTVIFLACGVFVFIAVLSCSPKQTGNAYLTIQNNNGNTADSVTWNGCSFGYIDSGDSIYCSVNSGTSSITYYLGNDLNNQIVTSPVTVNPGDNDTVTILTNTTGY